MKYTFHIVDVFSSTAFDGNQLAVLPDEYDSSIAVVALDLSVDALEAEEAA